MEVYIVTNDSFYAHISSHHEICGVFGSMKKAQTYVRTCMNELIHAYDRGMFPEFIDYDCSFEDMRIERGDYYEQWAIEIHKVK